MKEVTLIIKVKAPDELPDSEVSRLVNRLIDAGEEDAGDTPDDWHDPDVDKIMALEIADAIVS